jgi:predicted DNA-binding protein
MSQRALNSNGGKAEKVFARVPDADIDRLNRLAARQGLTRSEYVRRALEAAIAADEAQEVAAEAS